MTLRELIEMLQELPPSALDARVLPEIASVRYDRGQVLIDVEDERVRALRPRESDTVH